LCNDTAWDYSYVIFIHDVLFVLYFPTFDREDIPAYSPNPKTTAQIVPRLKAEPDFSELQNPETKKYLGSMTPDRHRENT